MSGLLSPRPAAAAAGAAAPPGAAAGTRAVAARDSVLVRLVTFGALAAFAAAHWAMLVVEAPVGRTLAGIGVAIGAAGALVLVGRAPLPRPAAWTLAGLIGIVALGLGLMAAGLSGRLLLPEGWSELMDGLDRGLAGVQGVDWPYEGPDPWIRLTILLGAPLLLALAATVAFWPARRAAPLLRVAGLVLLLLLYGTAVTEHDPGAALGRGLILLVLIAAYLWLPRMPTQEAMIGGSLVLVVGVLSLPLAAALDGERAWWDYRAWSWFGDGKTVNFDWTHQYGPLDWPRDGTTLLNVKADRPHYWKAQALDTFDGFRWIRSTEVDQARLGTELPFIDFATDGATWDNGEYNPAWDEEIGFTVRSLSSTLVVGAGITTDIAGVRANSSADGTTRLLGDEVLRKGDTYTVQAYAPDPTAKQMRAAPDFYSDRYLDYTAIFLPGGGEDARDQVVPASDAALEQDALRRQRVFVPLRNDPESGSGPEADGLLRASEYERMYELSRSLTAGADTPYDAVKAVETHLQRNYSYTERVPTRAIPLNGFLFQEERGYCQHFSGAMALMLRMAGIPARVAAGFSPGSFNKDTREYRVRDLDAHSWVEVWFTGIGWVPFDPTPAASPAESQSSFLATSAAAADAGEVRGDRQGVAAPERVGDQGGAAGGSDGGGAWVMPTLLFLALGLSAGGGFWLVHRIRRVNALGPSERAEAQLGELRRALGRLGWEVPTATTLLALERRLGRFAGPASESYAGALRAFRYDPREPDGPALADRREVRRELSRGSVGDRVRGLLAMPPGGPRP